MPRGNAEEGVGIIEDYIVWGGNKKRDRLQWEKFILRLNFKSKYWLAESGRTACQSFLTKLLIILL